MKKYLLIIFFFFYSNVLVKGQALSPVAGDYRTAATGNWSSTSSWQVRDGAGGWATPAALPTSSSNVFIQRGHNITVDIATAACYNLHLDVNGVLNIGNNFVSISNKIRAYTATASTTSTTDGPFYTDTLPPASLALNANMVTSSSTGGLKFVGVTRNLNFSTEWNSNGTGNVSVVFALDGGATGTLGGGFKARSYTLQSGIVSTNQFVSAGAVGTGKSFVVKNGAKFISSRSSTTAPNSPSIAFASSTSTKCDSIVIESGGFMEFTSTYPTLDCSVFSNNGTVIYSATAAQTLLQPSTNGGVVANNLLSYKNLIISGSGLKTIPLGYAINVSDTFTLAGNSTCLLASGNTATTYLTYSAGGTLVASGTSTNYTLTATSLEWPAVNGPTNVAVTQNKLTFPASASLATGMTRKITGTLSLLSTVANTGLSLNTYNTLIMANGSTIFRNDGNSRIIPGTGAVLSIGEIATDKVNVTIGNTMTSDVELTTTTSPGIYGTLKILNGTYTISSSNRTITDLNNNGILVLPLSTATFTINGNLSGTGTITGNSAASLTIGGSSGAAGVINLTPSSQILSAFTINRPSGSVTFGSSATINTLNLTAGTVSDGGYILSVPGSITGTATHQSTGSGKIYMTGISASISAATLGRLEINPGVNNSITAASLTTINNDLILTSGYFNAGAYGNYVTVNGDLLGTSGTQTGNGRIKMTGNNNIIAGINVNNLEIATAGTITATANFSVTSTLSTGGLTLTSGTFNDGGKIITIVGGNLYGPSGVHVSQTGGKIIMTTSAGTRNISAPSLGNLETASTSTIAALNNVTVKNSLTLTSGILSDGGYTITVKENITGTTGVHTGTGKIKMTGSNNYISKVTVDSLVIDTLANITATNTFTVTKGLVLWGNLNDGGYVVTNAGIIYGSGIHTGTGRILMTGTVKKIVGRPTINNLEIAAGASVTGGFGVIITGTLYMNGNNITVDSLNGAPNTATFRNNSSVIRYSGNFNINGGIVQMGTVSTDLINIFITGNNLQCTNELPTTHIGNIDLTIGNGLNYTIKTNNKFVRNLFVSDGHLNCLFDTLTRTGFNLTVNNQATISGDFYLDSATYDYPGNPFGPFRVGPSLIINSTGKLKFGNVNNKTLYSNGLLVLRSRNTGTASVGDVTNGGVNSGNKILGAATVERFISNIRNLSTNTDPTVKAWRLISMPTKHDFQTIKQSWQEGGSLNSNPNPGYGTQIVSNGASWAANGFDTVANGPSVKYFDPVVNNYVGISSTNLPMDKGKAYMVFVRGSRARTLYNQAPDTTVLRERGTLNVGDTTYTVGTAGNQFVSLPNPFPSAIDYRPSLSTASNVAPFIYLYDPRMGSYGAFVTADINGNTTASTTYYTGVASIQSSQGFFVKTTTAAGSFDFKETSKVDGSAMTFRAADINRVRSVLKLNLLKNQNGNYDLTDGLMHVFGSDGNNGVDFNDALKFNNLYENISIKNSGNNLAIENRNLIQVTDTFIYQIGLRAASYQLQFIPENIQTTGVEAFLEDMYLNARTPVSLSDTTWVGFEVNTDAGSYAADRFRLVFTPMIALPLSFTAVTAVEKDMNVLVGWEVSNETSISRYEVERSADGIRFSAIGNKNAIGNTNVATYDYTDQTPLQGLNYYRIRSIGVYGDIRYSKIVAIAIEKNAQAFLVSPNPVGNDHHMTIRNDNLPAGTYEVNLYDIAGRIVFRTSCNKNDSFSTFNIQLPKSFSPGEYRLCLNNMEIKICESVLIE